MSKVDPESLPYRPCAGIALFNRDGLVWIGRRIDGPQEAEGIGHWWQMPQGGIDGKEDPVAAAKRELAEETAVTAISYLGEMDWIAYDLPAERIGKAWGGRYRGQKMKWVAFRFEGEDADVNVLEPGPGHKAEFSEWRWEKLSELPSLIVPFKREVYVAVAREFARFAGADA